jgi:hypothetical protein
LVINLTPVTGRLLSPLKPLMTGADGLHMLIGVVLLLCLATVPLAGGNLGALADLRFRAPWLALAGIGAQIVVISILPQGSTPCTSPATDSSQPSCGPIGACRTYGLRPSAAG